MRRLPAGFRTGCLKKTSSNESSVLTKLGHRLFGFPAPVSFARSLLIYPGGDFAAFRIISFVI
jgi:hypothetical protein